jgi:hypothetical protein
MVGTALRSPATTLAIVLAALITIPLADSLYRIPIQVSDSLEPIVIAAKYDSAQHLLRDSLTFSPTTFRPLRYLQTRALLAFSQATGLTYHAVFRGLHVVLLLMLIALFVAAVRVRNWPDFVAFTVAFPVLIGIHTFLSMLLEAFPVNHFAQVGVCAMGLFVLAQRQSRWFVPIVACLLLALSLSVIESGVMVWVTVICCAAAGLPGINRTTVVATTVVLAGYLLLRHMLGISSPGSVDTAAALVIASTLPRNWHNASVPIHLGSCFTTSQVVSRRCCSPSRARASTLCLRRGAKARFIPSSSST